MPIRYATPLTVRVLQETTRVLGKQGKVYAWGISQSIQAGASDVRDILNRAVASGWLQIASNEHAGTGRREGRRVYYEWAPGGAEQMRQFCQDGTVELRVMRTVLDLHNRGEIIYTTLVMQRLSLRRGTALYALNKLVGRGWLSAETAVIRPTPTRGKKSGSMPRVFYMTAKGDKAIRAALEK